MSFLQIASWNIEHLSGSPRAERRQSAFALADHIEMAGVDLIALQEVYVTPDDEPASLGEGKPPIPSHAAPAVDGEEIWRNADLDVVCHLLEEHNQGTWVYRILPNRQAGDRTQLCTVMWNSERVALDGIVPIPVSHEVDGYPLWDRTPHLLHFTSEITVWRRDDDGEWTQEPEGRRLSLVVLHMKSNYGGVTENRRRRGLEAIELCNGLQQIEHDPTLILIGDTNILEATEPAIETFIDNGLIDLNNNDGATYWSAQYAEAPFDRAFVAADRPEFRYSRQYILRSSDLQAHDRLLSDHYMIKVSIKNYLDDADPR